jgi:hypothetical protein
VKASAASAAVQSAGDAVTTFAEKLDALVNDAQDTNGDPKDKKDERAKEAVVVEADICRP